MQLGTILRGAAILLLAAGLAQARTREIEGVRFAEQVEARGTRFVLTGLGFLRYKVVFKGYVAALWRADGTSPASVLADQPKRLEITYFWRIGADDFADVTVQGMARNLSADELGALRPRIARFNALYRDVAPGDRYTLTYVPGHGTELALNGQPLGTVEGADFAAAMFGIWLGPRPLSPELKEALLGAA